MKKLLTLGAQRFFNYYTGHKNVFLSLNTLRDGHDFIGLNSRYFFIKHKNLNA
jgi:hypothetical protein